MESITNLDKVKRYEVKHAGCFSSKERETVVNIDEAEVHIYSNITSHMRSILDKNCIELIEANVHEGRVISVKAKAPLNFIKLSIRKSGRKHNSLCRVLN